LVRLFAGAGGVPARLPLGKLNAGMVAASALADDDIAAFCLV
jgi:hypothetical protein